MRAYLRLTVNPVPGDNGPEPDLDVFRGIVAQRITSEDDKVCMYHLLKSYKRAKNGEHKK